MPPKRQSLTSFLDNFHEQGDETIFNLLKDPEDENVADVGFRHSSKGVQDEQDLHAKDISKLYLFQSA